MTEADPSKENFQPISNYAYIADCHSQALISSQGSIDWCCMPRVDSACCFGRLLDWQRGGYCQIAPRGSFESSRRYLERTLILETTFKTPEGEVRLLDCFTMREGGQHHPHQQVLRVAEGLRGRVELVLDLEPRFDYGAIKPWIRQSGPGQFQVFGGSEGLFICGDFDFKFRDRHRLAGSCVLHEGERAR
ncbi:MAG TPA: trehalase-like domain-containing protein, partial [Desulfobaccales bacterium]|nr:trehalase-like domain-containing protein [Desulfobaccales bacterium]